MPGAFDWLSAIRPADEAERLRRQQAGVGSVADLGGITSFLSNNVGTGEYAQEIARLKAQDPNVALAADLVNPLSIGGAVLEGGKGLYDLMSKERAQPPKAMSQDEFLKERSREVPTKGQYVSDAVERVRNSPSHAQAIKEGKRTTAARMLKAEEERASKAYAEDEARIRSDNAKLPEAYKGYTAGVNDELETYYGQDFKDRNPGLSEFAAIAGPVAAGLLTRGAFKKINGTMGKWGMEAKDAFAKGDIPGEAKAIDKLKWWTDKGITKTNREQRYKGLAVGMGGAVPLEIQGMGDIVDSKALSPTYQDADGNWQPALAQQKAAEKLSDLPQYLQDNSMALVSGVLGAGYGAKFGGKSQADEAASIVNPPSAERYAELARNQIAGLEASKAVQAAKTAGATPATPATPSRGTAVVPPSSAPVTPPVTQVTPPVTTKPPRAKPDPKAKLKEDRSVDRAWNAVMAQLRAGQKVDLSKHKIPAKRAAGIQSHVDNAKADAPNVPPEHLADILDGQKTRKSIKVGLAGAATGYSAILAKKLADLEAQSGGGEQEF